MLRALAMLVVLAVAASPADAQVFKPKAKKAAPAKAEKKAAAPKKQPRAAPNKKRPAVKKKAADRSRSDDDEASEPAPKGGDKDYVKIWDDEEIE